MDQPENTRPAGSSSPFIAEAFSLIERNIATSVESERKARFSTLAATGQDTFGGLAGRIGLETFAAYRLSEARIKSYINQAYQQAIDQHNFVVRREDKERNHLTFSSLTGDLEKFDPLVPYCIPIEPIRLLVVSLIMGDAGQDGAVAKTQAFDLIERNVIAVVERDRKEIFQALATPESQNTFAGLVGRVGLETLKAYGMPPARVASYVNQAAAMAVNHYNFLTRREENELPLMEWVPRLTPDDDSEIDTLPHVTVEVVRLLTVSLIVLDAGQDSSGMKTQAFELIERNVTTSVESGRKTQFSTLAATGQDTFGGLAGRIGLETFAAYRLSEARIKSYINQAYQQAIDQHNFVVRREDKERALIAFLPLTNNVERFRVSVEPIRLLVVSLIMLDAGQDGTALKPQAFDLIERNVVAAVERDRKEIFQTLAAPENQNTFAGIVGRVGLETFKAYGMPPARVASYVNQAAAMAVDHFNFLTRREENELPSMEWLPRLTPDDDSEVATPLVTAEIVRMLTVSLIVLDAGQDSSGMKQQAFELIERNVVAAVESARSVVTGEVGRLHNELTTGLKVPTARMTKLLNQAVSEVISHQNFLARADDDNIPSPPITYEQKRLLVESYLVALAGNAEFSLGLKKAALDLVERDITANDETFRRSLRAELSMGSPNSFGYYWGRIGLGFDGSLTLSNNAIKRAVISAEESLMNSGKWVGTVADYSFTLEASGEVFLPREVETVLFVTFDGDPRPVHDRFAEYMRGGTGIKTADEPWRSGFSDRGDAVDPEDGITKRKYFVSVPQENKQTLVRYLAKRRFVPHLEDTEPMYLSNYEAVSQAALAILTQGKAGSFDAARKLLADQMTQQYFKSQVFGIHNRSILAMR